MQRIMLVIAVVGMLMFGTFLTPMPRALAWSSNCNALGQGVDLSGCNLSNVNLSGANLMGANLFGANLFGANLSNANL